MNYRHIYHAGNFADVLKHAVQVAVIRYLQQKDKAFLVLDSHAGIGRYDLSSVEAQKTGEFQQGIARLMAAKDRPAFFDDYIRLVESQNPGGDILSYPGSPLISSWMLRDQDRLTACELHPEDGAELADLFAGDRQVRVLQQDGYHALKSELPPPQRRGLVMIDPPFEKVDEFETLVAALKQGVKRFANGTYMIWYPIKQRVLVEQFYWAIDAAGFDQDMLKVEMMVRPETDQRRFNGTGLLLINPPWTLQSDLETVMPWLTDILAWEDGASWSVEPISA